MDRVISNTSSEDSERCRSCRHSHKHTIVLVLTDQSIQLVKNEDLDKVRQGECRKYRCREAVLTREQSQSRTSLFHVCHGETRSSYTFQSLAIERKSIRIPSTSAWTVWTKLPRDCGSSGSWAKSTGCGCTVIPYQCTERLQELIEALRAQVEVVARSSGESSISVANWQAESSRQIRRWGGVMIAMFRSKMGLVSSNGKIMCLRHYVRTSRAFLTLRAKPVQRSPPNAWSQHDIFRYSLCRFIAAVSRMDALRSSMYEALCVLEK